ncbi:MAG: hypothetical protein U0903_08690 [Planctomycetales bacterium]
MPCIWMEGSAAMILLIDNYDSFVYNLSRYLQELGCETASATMLCP